MENVSSRCGKSDNAPRLRFPEFSGEWVEKKIKEFANCYAGATPSTKERKYWENGTIPWLSSGEVNKKHISFTDNFITKIGYDSCSTKMIPANTVVMALAGQGKTRGTVAITEIELCTNQSLASIVTNETVDDKFLLYYLETQYSNLRAISSGDGTRGGLNLNIINEYSVFLASLPEQKKIAAFFTLLDRRIQKQRQLVEFLKTYKRGVIDKFFCNNSYDFELYRLEEIGKFIRGLSYKEDEQTYDNQKTLVLRSNNIRDNGFLNYKEGLQFVTKIPDCEQLLQKNDLVFCMANGSSKLVGKNAVYDGRYNGKITVGTFCCIYRSKFHILQYYFQSSLFQKTLGKIQQGGGGSIGNLKPSDLEPLIVKLPNKYTQEKIFNCLSFFDSYIKLHENKLSSLLSLKSSLLQKMFI